MCAFSFIISPLFSIPLYIKGIKSHQKVCFYFLCLVFAMLGAYMVPSADAYRYREIFYQTSPVQWKLLYLTSSTKDWLYWALSYLLGNIISFEAFKFLLNVSCYFLYTWMFFDIVKRNRNLQIDRKSFLLAWFAILISVRFFTINEGIRFGVAATYLPVAIYLLSIKSYTKGISLYAIAFFMHFSMILFAPIVIFASVVKHVHVYKWIKLLTFFILLLFFNDYIGTIVNMQAEGAELAANVSRGYVSGAWSTEGLLKNGSFGGIMFTVVRIIPIIPLLYYYFKREQNTFLSYVALGGIMLLSISLSSMTILLRYSNMTIAVFFINYLIQYTTDKRPQLKVCLWSFIFVFICYGYSQRAYFVRGYALKSILCPITVIYSNPYTDEWVATNLDAKGELK